VRNATANEGRVRLTSCAAIRFVHRLLPPRSSFPLSLSLSLSLSLCVSLSLPRLLPGGVYRWMRLSRESVGVCGLYSSSTKRWIDARHDSMRKLAEPASDNTTPRQARQPTSRSPTPIITSLPNHWHAARKTVSKIDFFFQNAVTR
jgi:hypothetical protein